MKWSKEMPGVSGWYWVKVEADYLSPEVLWLENNKIKMAGYEGVFPASDVCLWGDKLEIPE